MVHAVGAAFSRGAALSVLVLAAGCVDAPETSLAKTRRAQALAAERAERARLERQLAVLRQTEGQLEQELLRAQASGVQAAATLRAVQSDLRAQVAKLQRAEQELAAAQLRVHTIEAELQPLRELETGLAEQRRQTDVLTTRVQEGRLAADANAAEVARLEAELTQRVAGLQRQLVAAQEFATALSALEAALAAAQAKVAPPPPPPTAAPAVTAPAAGAK